MLYNFVVDSFLLTLLDFEICSWVVTRCHTAVTKSLNTSLVLNPYLKTFQSYQIVFNSNNEGFDMIYLEKTEIKKVPERDFATPIRFARGTLSH